MKQVSAVRAHGSGKVISPHAGGNDLIGAEGSIGFEYAASFREQLGFVGDIHADMHQAGRVEGSSFEWQRECAGDFVRYEVVQADARGKGARDLEVILSQVDTGHATPVSFRNEARGATNAAADIEYV